MKFPALGLALLLFGALAARVPDAACATRAARADSLFRSANARLAGGRLDERRQALAELQEAVLLAPDSARYWTAFGYLNLEAKFNGKARDAFERAIKADPTAAQPRLGLGQMWKRDWILMLDKPSLERAITDLRAASDLDPHLADAWLGLEPLLMERGDLTGARAAAEAACAAAPDRPEALLAAGCVQYQLGHLERADSLFAIAIPRLPAPVRAHFDDVTPLVDRDTGDDLKEQAPRMRAEFARRFWSGADPDPTTPLNEARVEYRARVAHAVLMFTDLGQLNWDQRAELYVRYGAPDAVAYELAGTIQARRVNRFDVFAWDRYGGLHRIGEPMWYPFHSQVWGYEKLGLAVLMQDLALSDHYQMPFSAVPFDPVPDDRALNRSDLLVTAGRHAAFRTIPPGVTPLDVRGSVAQFEGDRGMRLLAQIECPGTPVDSIFATCVLTDSSEHEVAHAGRALSPSGCDPTALRVGDFTFDVAPGVYRVAFTVRDAKGGRGISRANQDVEAIPAGLAMSDVVVACGPIDVVPGQPVRIGPNLRSRVAGAGPMVVYFELYRLAPNAGNVARFEYEYTVEALAPPPHRPWYERVLPFIGREPHYVVRSEETNVGALRRQFVTVPIQSLRPGPYRLIVRVKDLGTGRTTTGSARFERV